MWLQREQGSGGAGKLRTNPTPGIVNGRGNAPASPERGDCNVIWGCAGIAVEGPRHCKGFLRIHLGRDGGVADQTRIGLRRGRRDKDLSHYPDSGLAGRDSFSQRLAGIFIIPRNPHVGANG